MKHIITLFIRIKQCPIVMSLQVLIISALLIFNTIDLFSQGAAINISGSPADPSAMLDISSDNKGVLIPRVSEAQKNLILSPAIGLIIYQTDNQTGLWYYDGLAWVQGIGQAGATGTTGATGVTGATGADGASGLLVPGTSAGNTPYWDGTNWVVNSSNIFNNGGSIGIGTSSPHNSAAIDISSSTKGVLIPRLTSSERNAMISPAEGLQIFNTTTRCFEAYINNLWLSMNCYGFKCGSSTVADIDGNVYKTVFIGAQCWMAENLRVLSFPNGSPITKGPSAQNAPGWENDYGYYSCPPNSSNNGEDCSSASSLGYLYQWSAAMNGSSSQGARGICPEGWHVPTYDEYNILNRAICYENGGANCDNDFAFGVNGNAGTNGEAPDLAGHSSAQVWTSNLLTSHKYFANSGLNLPPSGYRSPVGLHYRRGQGVYLWTSSKDGANYWLQRLYYTGTIISRYSESGAFALAVRCVKD